MSTPFMVGYNAYADHFALSNLTDTEQRRGWQYARRCEFAALAYEAAGNDDSKASAIYTEYEIAMLDGEYAITRAEDADKRLVTAGVY